MHPTFTTESHWYKFKEKQNEHGKALIAKDNISMEHAMMNIIMFATTNNLNHI